MYRLNGSLLVPPSVQSPKIVTNTFEITSGQRPCTSDFPGVRVSAGRSGRLRFTVDRNALSAQPDRWLRRFIADLETQGCIPAGSGTQLAVRIAESVPLEINVAFRLLYSGPLSGQMELTSAHRLQVVSPIVKDASDPEFLKSQTISSKGNSINVDIRTTENFIGFETARYEVEARTGGGYSIMPQTAERNVSGQIEVRDKPATNYFPFPPEARFFRLFYKAGQSEFTALAIGARTAAELETRARMLETGVASCDRFGDDLCIAIPKRVAVNALVAVMVNGKEVTLPYGETVSSAIRHAGETDPGRSQNDRILPNLSIRKLHNGRLAPLHFDHQDATILRMILTGGESLTWK